MYRTKRRVPQSEVSSGWRDKGLKRSPLVKEIRWRAAMTVTPQVHKSRQGFGIYFNGNTSNSAWGWGYPVSWGARKTFRQGKAHVGKDDRSFSLLQSHAHTHIQMHAHAHVNANTHTQHKTSRHALLWSKPGAGLTRKEETIVITHSFILSFSKTLDTSTFSSTHPSMRWRPLYVTSCSRARPILTCQAQ